jgi:formate hydrogenlyase subunit 4
VVDRRLPRPAGAGAGVRRPRLKLAVIGVGIVLIETGLAKMRIFRLTEFLGAAFLMATLGMLSFFILE